MKTTDKLSKDLEKTLRPIFEEFAREVEKAVRNESPKVDHYVANYLKEAAELGSGLKK